jgi:tetratricopeptide (TPR) repeat protein
MRNALVLALIGLTGPASAEEAWVRARSPHAEVLSNGTATQARRAAEHVEAVRRVFAAALAPLPLAVEEARPPLVLVFRDRGSFSGVLPLRDNEPQQIDGLILGGTDRTYLVVHLAAVDFEAALAHEYAHHLLNPVLAAQPPWLGEGLAELLAGATVWPGSATIGRPSEGHVRRIARDGLMPLRELLAVGYLSATYQGDRRELFYAQSWALVHWIVAGGHGGVAGLVAYTKAIADGDDPATAFTRSFGVTPDAAQASLASYVATRPLPTISVALPESAAIAATADAAVPAIPVLLPPVDVAPVDPAEMDAVLGDVLLRGGRVAEARARFSRAVAAGHAAAHEGLAAADLRDGKLAEARRHIESALAADPDDARALQRRAEHIVREVALRGDVIGDAETQRAVAVLERALAADPDLADAAELLARLRPAPLAHRIALLRRAVARQPERADLAFTLSSLHVKRNDLAEAARVLRRARENTRDEAHRFLSGHLLRRIGVVTSGQVDVRGTIEAIECLPGGALAFRLRTASGVSRLTAASPNAFFLYDREGETLERDLTCGPASIPVTARYAPAPGTDTHRLLSLTFDDGP